MRTAITMATKPMPTKPNSPFYRMFMDIGANPSAISPEMAVADEDGKTFIYYLCLMYSYLSVNEHTVVEIIKSLQTFGAVITPLDLATLLDANANPCFVLLKFFCDSGLDVAAVRVCMDSSRHYRSALGWSICRFQGTRVMKQLAQLLIGAGARLLPEESTDCISELLHHKEFIPEETDELIRMVKGTLPQMTASNSSASS